MFSLNRESMQYEKESMQYDKETMQYDAVRRSAEENLCSGNFIRRG